MDKQEKHGWFWPNFGMLQAENCSDCIQSIFCFKKFDLLYVILRTEQFKSKLTDDRYKWLPKQLQNTNVSSLFTRNFTIVLTFN